MFDPRDIPPREVLARGLGVGIAEAQMRKLLAAVIGHGDLSRESLARRGIGQRALDCLLNPLPRLHLERCVSSRVDRFEKLLFRTADGLTLETVIIPLERPATFSVCLSSQIGCVMGCQFCATGRMSQRRNLKMWEILDQLLQARALVRARGGTITSVVFMGMGEPFLNYDSVIGAAEALCYPVFGAISGRAITVSTVGLVREIERFTASALPFRLSISLGAATDDKRKQLVPVAARTPVAQVMAAARAHALARNDRVNLAYVCISGVNVSSEDAEALGRLVGDTPVRLDLIDVNDSTGRYQPPTASELALFRDALRAHLRQPVARRYSGGADIQAACGTLAGEASIG